ncbi:hypothetical protein [Kribbella lupini]|uniref:Uncharacterized protein n=1 Tax=Kribbella lupini TaxID=291602 RepID=A0ABP4MK95_9ACTN
MRDVRRSLYAASGAFALVAAGLAVPVVAGAQAQGGSTEYLVLVEQGPTGHRRWPR